MIYDSMQNIEKYSGAHPRFASAVEFLKKLIREDARDGHYVLSVCGDDGEVFANISTYESKPACEAVMESHRKYIDLQYIVSGEECIFVPVATAKQMQGLRGYDKDADYELYSMPGENDLTRLDMRSGSFAVFFPGELHAPGISPDGKPEKIHKIVVKILF